MALIKQGYKDAIRGTTSSKVPITADGNIAQSSEEISGTKRFNFRFANAENGLNDNSKLLNIFLGFVGGSIETGTNEMSVKWQEA